MAPEAEMTAVGTLGAAPSENAADWSCLGAPPAVVPALMGAGNVSYSVPLRSLFGAPLSNVVARSCQATDVSCANPLSETRGLSPEGLLTVEVPLGFAGFLEILSDDHVPTLFQMRAPMLRDTVDPQVIAPIPVAGVGMLSAVFNVEVVPELAIVSVAVIDCRGVRAPGARFTNNLGGRGFYFADGLPSPAATATDVSGLGGFINVPIRPLEITADLEADGRVIGTRTLLPRTSWLNAVQVRPPALPYD